MGQRIVPLVLLVCLELVAASQPWRKDPRQWAKEDADRVMNGSPWAQGASATFPDTRSTAPQSVYDLPGPAQAGMPAPKNAATDGHWDGGVGRNTGGGMLPTLSVLVRWDSALPIRQAVLRLKALGSDGAPGVDTAAALQEPKSYIVTVIGLIPANQYKPSGNMPKKSTSDGEEGTRPPLDTEQVLEGLMNSTQLVIRGHSPVRPEDVKLEAETGIVHVFFPRSYEIKRSDKEVVFSTRFGSLSVTKVFRLSDMMYQNRLEL